MEDHHVMGKIEQLSSEERALFEKESQGKATDADKARLKHLQVVLDQCWDLLRQRRARRAAGQDPNDAKLRDPKIVENYIG